MSLGDFRTPTPFEAWLIDHERLQAVAARGYASGLSRLLMISSTDEILTGDIDAIVDRHPRVAGAEKHRSRRAQPLRRAGRLYRRFLTEATA